jgi:hypothetical protein
MIKSIKPTPILTVKEYDKLMEDLSIENEASKVDEASKDNIDTPTDSTYSALRYKFNPMVGITVEELAGIFWYFNTRIGEELYGSMPTTLQRHFVDTDHSSKIIRVNINSSNGK